MPRRTQQHVGVTQKQKYRSSAPVPPLQTRIDLSCATQLSVRLPTRTAARAKPGVGRVVDVQPGALQQHRAYPCRDGGVHQPHRGLVRPGQRYGSRAAQRAVGAPGESAGRVSPYYPTRKGWIPGLAFLLLIYPYIQYDTVKELDTYS